MPGNKPSFGPRPRKSELAFGRSRQKYRSARAFFISILIISCLTIGSLLLRRDSLSWSEVSLKQRGEELSGLGAGRRLGQDLECRNVHHAKDQCAYVRANCPDEEAGLISYLSLYYCRLSHAKPVAFIIMLLWLGLLFSTIGIAASDFFCINLSTIATILGMTESMAGVTFLAFGNGSPDVFSTFAAMSTHSGSLAIGELIGAAGFITAVVAGSMALVRPFRVSRRSFVRDVGFFIVAASFSMVFLADGSLHLWECGVMVGFYVFYVASVMLSHWWIARRRRRRERISAARSSFAVPGHGLEEIHEEPEAEEEEEDTRSAERRSLLPPGSRGSTDDFGALERGNTPPSQPSFEEEDEDVQDRWLAELNNNMRLNRPPRGPRRNTITPIRPSLFGALEFRTVLSSLNRSRNFPASPMNFRRFSDASDEESENAGYGATLTVPGQVQSAVEPDTTRNRLSHVEDSPNRRRSASTNTATNTQADVPRIEIHRNSSVPGIGIHSPSPPHQWQGQVSETGDSTVESAQPSSPAVPPSPVISISPPPSERHIRIETPRRSRDRTPRETTASPEHLHPSHHDPFASFQRRHHSPPSSPESGDISPRTSPKGSQPPSLRLDIPDGKPSSQGSSPTSPFPPFCEHAVSPRSVSRTRSIRASSIQLPPPSLSPECAFQSYDFDMGEEEEEEKPLSWWPYKYLPPPEVFASTLFPTLYAWGEKSLWEKVLGIIAAPSLFVLAITLPIVEADREDDGDAQIQCERRSTSVPAHAPSVFIERRSIAMQPDESPTLNGADGERSTLQDNPQSDPSPRADQGKKDSKAAALQNIERMTYHPKSPVPPESPPAPSPVEQEPPSSIKQWNRWLISIQVFTAPLFLVSVVWANAASEPLNPRSLIQPILWTLLASLIALALLYIFTSAHKAPRWRYALCFVGFAVSIAWISTIANEVVGVLKAFGVILNISDAILGLTVFAVGNSLGDLVADITVARLGYPVMALSACFGGPMLNILLGIGLSGLYMTIQAGRHRHEKHPHRPVKYKPYQIEVSNTLLISAVSLLVTLVGLLVIVPLNKWRLDRRIGWGLIALWCASTIGNVVVEIVGQAHSH
ncbi:hypothetical protein L228DRAFT_258230 [Xylona heveae TC161]|uniref:Sodium/calcium exchanger membrane region domain-containing protein n=1 Tax=Xylona heveae (strain CBS 132557 / TC161) TaxID=1328760 RepID=A0A165K112_XYLHT|nr:hypothetical protein L228DRAFT_258230 [Xylona heveae TC161]KZF26870.1 hypothetical protein L228DRAFT_258230 [Xylona heveae TC161]